MAHAQPHASKKNSDKRHIAPLGIIFVGLLTRIPFLFAPMTYGHEVWRQADTASIARHFWMNGYHVFYPQIYWGGAGPGYVESEFQIYPFIVALLYGVAGEHLWIGRLVSLLFFAGASYAFYSLARRILPGTTASWAAAFFVFAPLNFRMSIAFMPEAAMLFFYVLGFAFFSAWLAAGRRRDLAGAACSFAMAMLIKPTVIHAGLALLALVYVHRGFAAVRRPAIWWAALAAMVPAVLWYTHARELYLAYGNTFGILSGGDSKWGGLTYWLDPRFYASIVRLEIVWVFGAWGVVLFVFGMMRVLRNRSLSIVWIGYGTIAILYLAVARYAQAGWGVHYHIVAVPFAALGCAAGMEWVQEAIPVRFRRAVPILVIAAFAVTVGMLYYLLLGPGGNYSGTRLVRCAEFVRSHVPDDARIVVSSTSSDQEDGVPNNFQDPTIFFYAHRYGWSLPANRHTVQAIHSLRSAGANYFVNCNRSLLVDHPEFASYLRQEAAEITSDPELECLVYKFREVK